MKYAVVLFLSLFLISCGEDDPISFNIDSITFTEIVQNNPTSGSHWDGLLAGRYDLFSEILIGGQPLSGSRTDVVDNVQGASITFNYANPALITIDNLDSRTISVSLTDNDGILGTELIYLGQFPVNFHEDQQVMVLGSHLSGPVGTQVMMEVSYNF